MISKVSPGNQLLAKKPEGSGYKIDWPVEMKTIGKFLKVVKNYIRARKKCRPNCPGQVQDFPVEQFTFHSHLPNGQGPRQVICQLNCQKSNLRHVQGKQNL